MRLRKRHVENIKDRYGLTPIVAINRYQNDTEKELKFLEEELKKIGVELSLTEVWAKGGEGAIDLAEKVVKMAEGESKINFVYDDKDSIKDKILKVAKEVYGAEGVEYTDSALEDLENFHVDLELKRCGKCQNNCLLTINPFSTGDEKRRFITGNRCERGAELEGDAEIVDASNAKNTNAGGDNDGPMPNLFAWKYNRLFSYKPLSKDEATRGDVGIPRVLNMYENYPMWFTFFTKLGFRVRLSPRSTRSVYEYGLETIPSESVCYPGKISHGHIESLLKSGVKFIFYPCAPYEQREDEGAGNHYNCPIVTSYPEVLRNNIDALRQDDSILFMNPFLPIYDKQRLAERLFEELGEKFNISAKEIEDAVDAGWAEQAKFRRETQIQGEEALEGLKKLHTHSTLPNLLDTHPPFQIDGNFGGTAGVTEMLMQSHMGFIHLLPALPDAWKDGEVKGLCAKGNFELDIQWNNGELVSVNILSKNGGNCELRYQDAVISLKTVKGKTYGLAFQNGKLVRK